MSGVRGIEGRYWVRRVGEFGNKVRSYGCEKLIYIIR